MVIRMFPPFPMPGFVPNFTAFELDRNASWYEVQKSMAQQPIYALSMVSNTDASHVLQQPVYCLGA